MKSTYYILDASGNQLLTYEHDVEQEESNYQLAERVIYGSSRLGINVNKVDMLDENPEEIISLSLGNKLYEMSNHLGNVLTVINDIKIPVSSNSVDIDGYLATIVSTADYSPFGVQLDGRTESADSYRFGFGGHEKDDEVKGSGNSYDFGARILDPRLGRWLSRDPKEKLFSQLSPYNFAANNPIYYVDADGAVIRPSDAKSIQAYNTAVLNTFSENGCIVELLTIRDGDHQLGTISPEDYEYAMSTLTDIDQKAAFRGLYLAANDEMVYDLQVASGNESVFINGESRKASEIPDGVGWTYDEGFRDPNTGQLLQEGNTVDIVVNTDHAGNQKPGEFNTNVNRDLDAMILGSLIASCSAHNKNESIATVPEKRPNGILQIQCENIIHRVQGRPNMLAAGFKDGDIKDFSSSNSSKIGLLPAPVVYQFIDYVYKMTQTNMLTGNEAEKEKYIDNED